MSRDVAVTPMSTASRVITWLALAISLAMLAVAGFCGAVGFTARRA